MRFSLIALAMIGAAGASAAAPKEEDPWAAPAPPWEGTWQGTIGKLPIHMCLNNTPYMNQGAYYYDAHRELIRLDLADNGQDWVEGDLDEKSGAKLKLGIAGGKLAGSWTDGNRTLPVQLRRIGGSSQEYEGPCSSMEFQRPRVGPVLITAAPGLKDGAKITTWSFKPGLPFKAIEVSTFTLDRPGSAVAKVNAKLRGILPKPDGSGGWLDCMATNTNAHGVDGDYSEEMEPTLITQRWLAVRHSGGEYCGGAHPNSYSNFRTFDLATGEEIDLHDWFNPKAVQIEHYSPGDDAKMMSPEFVAMLLRGWKPSDPECQGVFDDQRFWGIGLARGSMVFSPAVPHVMLACSEDFEVPFAKLQPWLNAKGKAALATLPR